MDNNTNLPRTWQDFLSGQQFFPVVVKSTERIHDRTWEMRPNCHDHFEMVYVKKGNIIYKVNNTEVPLNQYDLILIKPNQTHLVTVRSQEVCEFFVLRFSFEAAKGGEGETLTRFMDFINVEEESSFIRLRLTRKNDFTSIFDKIAREQRNAQLWSHLQINVLMMELFILLSRSVREGWDQSIKDRYLKMKELLRTAKTYIDVNYNKNITLSDISSYIFFSESYFAHSFKQEYGISPKSYILKARIDASKELLENSNMNISDIALSVGFSGQQRFNDIFKKFEHITPLKYRKNMRLKYLNLEK